MYQKQVNCNNQQVCSAGRKSLSVQYIAAQERLTARGKQNFRGDPPYAEFKQNSESQCQAASAPQNRSTCVWQGTPSVTPRHTVKSRETTTAKARRRLGAAVTLRLRQHGSRKRLQPWGRTAQTSAAGETGSGHAGQQMESMRHRQK